MTDSKLSPVISRFSWGRIVVNGYEPYRDAKLYPGGAREWDWSESDTHHHPGIQPEDIIELLEHEPTTVVLATGVLGRLHVCPETLRLLEARGIDTHTLPTEKAVELYNELCPTTRVAGLFHSTC